MKKEDSRLQIPLIIVLGLFTFGISDLFWVYKISERVNIRRYTPMKQVALLVITLGVYGIFWTYMIQSELEKRTGCSLTWKKPVCVLLSALFLRCISVAVINGMLSEADAGSKDGGDTDDRDRM